MSSQDEYVYLNGRMLLKQQARVSPLDRGFLYGDGFFETMRVFGGVPFLIHEHLLRLRASCEETGWGAPPSIAELQKAAAALIEESKLTDCYLRVTVSRGKGYRELTRLEADEPLVLIEARRAPLPALDSLPEVVLARSPYRRNEHSPVVRHKSLSYQFNLLSLAEGRRAGADEVYFLNSRGLLTEGATTNLFFVRQGKVFTPDVLCGLLPGITRKAVIQVCDAEHIPLEIGEYAEDSLKEADEVFCTNSLKGVMAVNRILNWPEKRLSKDLTTCIQAWYAERVREHCRL